MLNNMIKQQITVVKPNYMFVFDAKLEAFKTQVGIAIFENVVRIAADVNVNESLDISFSNYAELSQ